MKDSRPENNGILEFDIDKLDPIKCRELEKYVKACLEKSNKFRPKKNAPKRPSQSRPNGQKSANGSQRLPYDNEREVRMNTNDNFSGANAQGNKPPGGSSDSDSGELSNISLIYVLCRFL